jgi:hypothetical protein
LQNNGGPTQTIALQRGSPAIDAIPAGNCPEVDQRGVNRPDNFETACDIGSYEFFDFAGTPGQKDCRGDSISALSKQFGKTSGGGLGFRVPEYEGAEGGYSEVLRRIGIFHTRVERAYHRYVCTEARPIERRPPYLKCDPIVAVGDSRLVSVGF